MLRPVVVTPLAPAGEQNSPDLTTLGDGAGDVAGAAVTAGVGADATIATGAPAGATVVTTSVVAGSVVGAAVVDGPTVVDVVGAVTTMPRTGTVVDGDLRAAALPIAPIPPRTANPPTTPTRTLRRRDMPVARTGAGAVVAPDSVGDVSALPLRGCFGFTLRSLRQ